MHNANPHYVYHLLSITISMATSKHFHATSSDTSTPLFQQNIINAESCFLIAVAAGEILKQWDLTSYTIKYKCWIKLGSFPGRTKCFETWRTQHNFSFPSDWQFRCLSPSSLYLLSGLSHYTNLFFMTCITNKHGGALKMWYFDVLKNHFHILNLLYHSFHYNRVYKFTYDNSKMQWNYTSKLVFGEHNKILAIYQST